MARSRGARRGVLEVGAIGVGAAAGAAAYLSSAPLWATGLAALAGWFGLQITIVRPMARRAAVEAARIDSMTLQYDAAIAEVRASSAKLAELARQARDPEVRSRGLQIVENLNRVVHHIEQDPDDLLSSQKFLTVYIQRTKAILARYLQFETLATPQAEQVRAKVRDELLPVLITLCEQQLQRITYDDLRSLDMDVDVLKKAIQLEDL